jgi:hypothetical protein
MLEKPDEDEISLVDLFIVLVRRRRIIIGITAAAVVLALAVFYAAPALGLNSRYSYAVEASFVPVQFPPVIKTEIGIDLPSYAKAIATAPGNLVGPVWAMGLAGTRAMAGPDDPDFLNYLKKDFVGKKYTCTIGGDGGLRLTLRNQDRAVAESFLKAMVELTDLRLRQDVAKRARSIADSMEAVLAESGKKGLPVAAEAQQMFLASRGFADEDAPLLQPVAGLETSRERKGRSTGAVVTVIAGLFLSVLVAFVVEAVANVRKDEDAMRRLREAMAHGKKA